MIPVLQERKASVGARVCAHACKTLVVVIAGDRIIGDFNGLLAFSSLSDSLQKSLKPDTSCITSSYSFLFHDTSMIHHIVKKS